MLKGGPIFIELVSAALESAPFLVIAAAIDKAKHVRQHKDPGLTLIPLR